MKISVTKEDIDKGLLNDPHECPVALAIKRANPELVFAVRSESIRLPTGFLDLPAEVVTWIYRYDAVESIEPFEFELDI